MNTPSTSNSTTLNKHLAVRVGAGLAAILFLAILAPIVWAAASAGVGLIALGVVGLVGFGLAQSLPLLGQKLENRLLSMRKAEARQNPIEQLQNFLREKAQRVLLFRGAVTQIGTQIKSLEDMLEERKRTKPNYDSSKQEKALAAMHEAHTVLKTKYQNAETALAQLKEVIDDKKFEWNFGQAGQAAIAQLNAASGEDLMNQMLADEAFSSVRDNFNHVFAELEMEAVKLSNTQQLSFDGGMTLDLTTINLSQPVQKGV